jgi:hypothetical protein
LHFFLILRHLFFTLGHNLLFSVIYKTICLKMFAAVIIRILIFKKKESIANRDLQKVVHNFLDEDDSYKLKKKLPLTDK